MANSRFSYKKELPIYLAKFLGCTALIVITFVLGIFSESIDRKIHKNASFAYETKIKGIDGYADVYKTRVSIPKIVKYIKYLEKPIDNTNLDEQNHIQFFYDDYYILIYKGETGDTMIQVSSRAYVHSNGYTKIYRPYNKNTKDFFDKTYKSSKFYKEDIKRYGKINSSNSIRYQ